MNLLKVEQLVKRYQEKDIVMFEILTGILDELKEITSSKKPNTIIWNKPKTLASHIAADYVINGGATWSVIGVATHSLRTYMTTVDERLMYFTWRIDNSTITGSGAGTNQLSIAIPSGYVCRGSATVYGPNDIFNGCGHHFHAGVLEKSVILIDETSTNNKIVRIFRPATAVWANHTADFTTRGSVLIPVERVGAIAQGM